MRLISSETRKPARHQAFLEDMRADWGGQTIWYYGPVLSRGAYVPTAGKLTIVSTAGPVLFVSKPVQVVVLEIDNDGWVTLMVGFDRRDQPVYRYARVEVLQNYADRAER